MEDSNDDYRTESEDDEDESYRPGANLNIVDG
jgi:hypothetical protein